MKDISALLCIAALIGCMASCDKKDNTPVAQPKPDTTAAVTTPTVTTTTINYPDTDVYIGTYVDSQAQEGSTTITPYTFYVIHLSQTMMVFMTVTSGCFMSVNDTAMNNDENLYVFTVPNGEKEINGPATFTISSNSLYYSFWSQSEVCSEPPPTQCSFAGGLQAGH